MERELSGLLVLYFEGHQLKTVQFYVEFILVFAFGNHSGPYF
jgi:hypothetical protein